ncbi:GlcNAc-PI de-N-acetylase [Chitinophaga costaii]|uniref:GlcNAc-PI de-N-acetylase n=1 Tax=Chitinophaga costaii TaxID=1335309 RepID=A0A1C4FDR3_9BACT|nr:PIG-L family deacetylase [Chitinophaga costaii]PUZ20674.1 LmbE family protein [Chitinophaga costaii]SCC53805.1 GlcNAc-PI de-N-acetylase [Chitinophaga costaii]
MFRKIIVWALAGFISGSVWAQQPTIYNAADIRLQLHKLDTLGSVLYFAAHPDDENTRLLAFLAKGNLYRTGYMALTRGDGGQNLIGNEQAALLGLIRTQELLAARRTDGAEQFFSRANDFGFSKNPAETFTFWDREKLLGDAVWVIRNFQPDVIICRFPPDSRAGHGHHTASAMIAAEAYTAAADPARFPEQLLYVKPWQAKRLLWNSYNFGNRDKVHDGQFTLNVGVFNPLLGKDFGEIAAQSRSMHKSQGFGVSASRGDAYEYFQTVQGTAPQGSLLDGVNTTWTRIAGGESVGRLVDQAIANFKDEDPAATVPILMAIRKTLQAMPGGYWQQQKLKETEQLILACTGTWLEATSEDATVVPGRDMVVQVQAMNRSTVPMELESITLTGKAMVKKESMERNKLISLPFNPLIPVNTATTQPYWLALPHPLGMYDIADQQMVGRPENVAPLQAVFQLKIAGESFTVSKPIQYKFTDPVKGEIYQPLVVAPPITGNLDNQVIIFANGGTQPVTVKLNAHTDGVKGSVALRLPKGFKAVPASIPFDLKAGDESQVLFNVTATDIRSKNQADTLTVVMSTNGQEYTQGITQIHYDHIPDITLFPAATAKLVSVNLKHNGQHLGYIPGAGDMVAASLKAVGYDVTILDEKDILGGHLQQYDAIITGVRLYNMQPRMKYWQPALMDYVQQGGTLLVQYNVNSELTTPNMGPYPFSLSGGRVTDETAPVQFLHPSDDALHYPNEISPADFDGWVQERGLYFTTNVDGQYTKEFALHDKGEGSLDGSTLVAHYGKGKYVYTSLAFFRQLPAGVPGAYRLFVNLISTKK